MNRIKYFLICLIIPTILSGQVNKSGKDLVLFSSSPDMRLDYSTYKSVFYKIESDSLIAIDTLNKLETVVTNRVIHYPFLNEMFIQESDFKNAEYNRAYFIDTQNFNIRSNKIPFERVYTRVNSLLMPQLSIVLGTDHSDTQNIYSVLDNDFKTFNITAIDFQSIVCSGLTGAPIKNQDVFVLKYDSTKNKLRIPKTFDVNMRPTFDFQMHEKVLRPKDEYMNLVIKNNKWVVLTCNQLDTENQTTAHIQSINKGNEHLLTVRGDKSRLRSFNDWIAGTVAEYNSDKSQKSPGFNYRKTLPNIYGSSFDIMADILELYYPGKLFIYHIPTRKYIEWETFENGSIQGDSEILLIEENHVYYRINQKIFKAEIIDNQKLGNPVLLIKDDRVRNIHWVFNRL